MFESKKIIAKKSIKRKTVPVKKVDVPEYSFDRDDEDCARGTVKYKGSEFNFEVYSDTTPYCCGLREFGSFKTSNIGRGITTEMRNKLINNCFEKLIENNDERTVLFTLVNNVACNHIRTAIAGGEMFTLVKSFINPNGGNLNDLYVSNS